VEYLAGDYALEQARTVRENRVVALEAEITEPLGQEVVLDLVCQGLTVTTTLLFRVVQQLPGQSVMEWWPRRQTDPDLLDLWIETLEQEVGSAGRPSQQGVSASEMQQVYELCRRSLAGNPFAALGLHWTATEADVNQAYEEGLSQLLKYKDLPGLGPKVSEFLNKARGGLQAAQQRLATLEERIEQRRKFVPAHQRDTARQLALSKLELARLRRDEKEYRATKLELRELPE
jgi:hypothetical protein